MSMLDLLAAFGLVLVIEGLLYLVAPTAMQRLAERLPRIAPSELRLVGGAIALLGLVIVAAIRL